MIIHQLLRNVLQRLASAKKYRSWLVQGNMNRQLFRNVVYWLSQSMGELDFVDRDLVEMLDWESNLNMKGSSFLPRCTWQ